MLSALGLAVVVPPVVVAGKSPDLLDEDWIVVRTPNFSVKSVLGERKTVELAGELELFRQVVLRYTNAESDASSIPTEIILLKRRSQLEKMGNDDRDVVGLFEPGLRNNLILMVNDRKHAQHIIQHEYVHFLVGQSTGGDFPLWYGEGFAEFMASSEVKGDEITLGDLPSMRVNDLESGAWIPYRKMIDRSQVGTLTSREGAMLYAQAWLLVHYLQLGRPDRDFSRDMASYVRGLRRGTPDVKAFELSFALEVDALGEVLREYVRRKRLKAYRIPLDEFDLELEASTNPIDSSDMAVTLARAMMQLGSKGLEAPYVDYSVAHDPDSAASWAASGSSLAGRGDVAEAWQHLEKALELAPGDPLVQLDIGEYWLGRAEAETKGGEPRTEFLSRANRHFLRAWKIDDSKPEAYAMYGKSLLLGGTRPEKAVEILGEAARLLPSDMAIRYDLAQAHRASGNGMQALRLASSIVASGHGGYRVGQDALALTQEIARTCTHALYERFVQGIAFDVHNELLESAEGPVEGTATIALQLGPDRSVRTLEVTKGSSEDFEKRLSDAVHSAAPFSSLSSDQLVCFGGRKTRIPFKAVQPFSCGESEEVEYRDDLRWAITRALHTHERMEQPGSGRISILFRVDEDGGMVDLQLGGQADTPLGRKTEEVVRSVGSLGPRPGDRQCWVAPVRISVDVLGSDAPIEE